MRQVATFTLPTEQDAANVFLKEHKPETINFNTNMIVVFYDDGTYPIEHQIADIDERLVANRQSRFDKLVALHVMKAEQAGTDKNRPRWIELEHAIKGMEEAIDNHDLKYAYALEEKERLVNELAQ